MEGPPRGSARRSDCLPPNVYIAADHESKKTKWMLLHHLEERPIRIYSPSVKGATSRTENQIGSFGCLGRELHFVFLYDATPPRYGRVDIP